MDKSQIIEKLEGFRGRLANEVVQAYHRGSSFGQERFEAWRKKFTVFLDENLPGQSLKLNKKLHRSAGVIFRGESAAERFIREDGETSVAFINSLILDVENDEVELESQPSPNNLREQGKNQPNPKRIFITHGRAKDWQEVQAYVERDIEIDTLELSQEPNLGRSILQKLDEESRRCCYAVIVMTGDDKTDDGQIRARETVLHEIGFFQARFGLSNVCLLHEEGVNIPSNIHGLVYLPFPKGNISAAFGLLVRELKAALK